MAKKIRHSGIVMSIDADCIKVQIEQKSACAHCSAAGQCNAAESKEKIVEVANRYGAPNPDGTATYKNSLLKVGDIVTVTASQKVGYLAVLFGAVLPFLVLVAFTVIPMLLTDNEPLSALIGIGAMAIYFCSLFFLREKMKSKLAFEIE